MTYIFTSIYPAAAVLRSARRLFPEKGDAAADTRPVPAWLNRGIIAWHGLESAILERVDSPLGLSILTVRQKRSL